MYPPIARFYDRTTAAAAAYGTEEEMQSWAQGIGCGDFEIIRDSGTDMLAFAAQGEEDAVVCFRGTADLRNWLTDLDARRVKLTMDNGQWTTGIKVHRGFQLALEGV